MNTIITSKEAILAVSRSLVKQKGWTAINIRTVASACNVSVGTIYNYFYSKSDLVAATVESVWCDIFHFPQNREVFDSFISCVEWAFESMRSGEERYPGFFSMHSMSFLGEGKTDGQRLMAQSWEHIRNGLKTVLINDKQVRANAFDEQFTPEKFTDIIFSLIVSALLRHDYDCSGIMEMIRRVLY